MNTAQRCLGVGVVGLRVGRRHLDGYRQNPNVRIIGACDPDRELLAKIKEEYRVEVAVEDYRRLLDNPEIGIVSVCSPDFYHAEQSVAALKAGKDVLCEKPMVLNAEEAKEIIRAVKETGRRFMVGQICRYTPGFVMAKQMIERGEIGELFLVESEYAHDYRHVTSKNNWRKDPRREPFLGGGCHAVDLLCWIAGEAEEVFAYANHKCLTLKYMRTKEHYLSVLDEVYAPGWDRKTMLEQVHERVEDIIASHHPAADADRLEMVRKYVSRNVK